MGITKSKRRNSVSLSQKDKVRCLNCNAFKTESSKFHSSNTTLIGVGIMEEQQRQCKQSAGLCVTNVHV